MYDILIILHLFSSQAIALPRLVTRERRSPTPQSDTTEEEETQLDEARYYLRKTSARGFGGKGLELVNLPMVDMTEFENVIVREKRSVYNT